MTEHTNECVYSQVSVLVLPVHASANETETFCHAVMMVVVF